MFWRLGINVNVIIIAVGSGFSGTSSSIVNPPTKYDLWRVGKPEGSEMTLEYTITSDGTKSSLYNASVSMNFTEIPQKTGM
jgi:hypothetical protein